MTIPHGNQPEGPASTTSLISLSKPPKTRKSERGKTIVNRMPTVFPQQPFDHANTARIEVGRDGALPSKVKHSATPYFPLSINLEKPDLISSSTKYPAGTKISEIAVANITPNASEMAMGIRNWA
jgi:hypothetical protein